jgi:hypothetical protein
VTAHWRRRTRAASRRLFEQARHPTRRVAVLALLAGITVVAVGLDLAGSVAAPRPITHRATGPTVPGPDTVSATWYCAEGSASSGGRADETIWIANNGDADAEAVVTVMPGGDIEPTSRRVTVPKRGQLRVPASSVLQAVEQPDQAGMLVGPGVVVEVFGGGTFVEHEIDGQSDVALGPCAREPGRAWYFAAGTTERGAEQNLALFNPFADDAILDLLFATDAGFLAPADLQSLVVPRRSRVTVPVANFVRRQAQVGVHVRVRTGRVVAEQSLVFTPENEARRGLTLSLGAPLPAQSWMLPGVLSGDGAANGVYVANFDSAAAEIEIDPRFEDGNTAAPSKVAMPGRSATTVDLGPFAGSGVAFAVEVRATRSVAIVAERLGARGQPSGATGSATALGSADPARDWVFALGRPATDDAAAVSVFNPNRSETRIRLFAYQSNSDQPATERELMVAAHKQGTFDLREMNVAPDQMIVVRADAPVVAARRILGATGASLAPGVPDPHAPAR